MAITSKMTPEQIWLQLWGARDALQYIATRKIDSQDPRELRAFIADLQTTARHSLEHNGGTP